MGQEVADADEIEQLRKENDRLRLENEEFLAELFENAMFKQAILDRAAEIEEKVKLIDAKYRENLALAENRMAVLKKLAVAAALVHLRWRGGGWDISAIFGLEEALLGLDEEDLTYVYDAANSLLKQQNADRERRAKRFDAWVASREERLTSDNGC